MLPVTNLRSGTFFQDGSTLFKVLKYEHNKVGRGTANIKVRARNLLNGAIVNKTFISGAAVASADIEIRKVIYLYQQDKQAIFMDRVNFEQFALPLGLLGKAARLLKEELAAELFFFQGRPISVELPIKVIYKVKNAAPGLRGDTVASGTKEIELENGLRIKAPLFIKTGDRVVVNTREMKYAEREAKIK